MTRVCIVGLDCLSPRLLFDNYWELLPNFRRLAADSLTTELMSCDPPITVPAWAAMLTGTDPGSLGVYGFRDRADHGYHTRRLASSLSYHQPPLWTILSQHQIRSRLLGIPQTYPPKPMLGYMVTGCLTPQHAAVTTYPPALADEVQALSGGYAFDAGDFRDLDPAALVDTVQAQSAAAFRLARAWIGRDDWQFFMMVDMGPDRLHHALWRYCCADHPRHVPAHPLAAALRDYYVQLDGWLGGILAGLRPDDVVMVVSDHGAQAMRGGVAINQWLQQRGDLVLKDSAPTTGPLQMDAVDWPRSRAWADGGYVGRIYFNVAGREPAGVLRPDAVPAFAAELGAALAALHDGSGPWNTVVHQPHTLYREVRGVPPDLLVYFDNLRQRAVGSLGHPSLFVTDNDTGPDGANHAHAGVLLLRDGRGARRPRAASLLDIAPTVLTHFGIPVPAHMLGHAIVD